MTFNNTTPANFFDVQSNGRASSSPFVDIFKPRDPTTSDITSETSINNYAIQQKWLNTTTNALWELKNYTTSQGVLYANWILIANHALVTESLRDQTGIDVFPDLTNEINLVGDGTYIITTGTPLTNTMTVSVTGAITTLYTENTGTATPMAGNLNVLGANGITTIGSGNTITIQPSSGHLFTGNTVDTFTGPGTNPVVPNASGLITVTGGQVAAGTTVNAIQTDSLAANTYTVQVQRSQAVASSTVGDNGVSHFNSADFTVDSNGFVSIVGGLGFSSINNQVFTTSGTYTPTTGMSYCQITCVGGGGGGGGAAATSGSQFSCGGGGGSGEAGIGAFSAATIGASQTITIGAAGAGISGEAGGTGGTSSVGALITAIGGSGGNVGTATTVSGASGGPGGTGGTGGDYHLPGDSGAIGYFGTSTQLIYGGKGGQGVYGQSGNDNFSLEGMFNNTAGNSATAGYGAAGGAVNGFSQTALVGGTGTPGIVIIQEFIKA